MFAVSKDNNYDFMKKLAPLSIEELEEILNKYPVPDKAYMDGKAMNNDDKIVVDEPVEVIKKAPWCRSSILYTAASLALVAGVISVCLMSIMGNTPVNEPMDSVSDVDTTEYSPAEATAVNIDLPAFTLAPVTDEWKKNVFFGSEFPYIIYADETSCVFTEGSDCIFIYDFENKNISFSCNVRETLDDAVNSYSENERYHITFSAYSREAFRILCSVTYPETFGQKAVETYSLDIADNCLFSSETAGNEMYTPIPCGELPVDDVSDKLSVNHASIGDGGYIYLANNHLCDDVTPGNGSHLPMIDIVKCTDKNGEIERFTPFGAETSCPFDDFSEDEVHLMSPAYAPCLLKASEDTTRTLAEALKASSWEMIDNDTPIPDGEAYSVFVYNNGQPFRLTFYGDRTADYEHEGNVQKYKVEDDAFLTVFNSANPKNLDEMSEQLVWCEPENITPDGVWKSVQTE